MTGNVKAPYNDRYYARHRAQYHDWEKRLAADFFARYQVGSVIDFGCGVGSYLDAAYDLGLSRIQGYELHLAAALPHVPVHLRPFLEARDVTEPIIVPPFDCSWSVEVGEHLEPAGTSQFVDNIVAATSRLALLTCAPPGQRGTSHINLRPQKEWIAMLCFRGMTYLPEDVEVTKLRWKTLGAPPYILRNLMIFERAL